MFIVFVIGIVVLGIAILGNLFSFLFPFIQNFGSIQEYYASYYGAVSSLERGLLVTKYKSAGFEGSGGWEGTDSIGIPSDSLSGDFSLLTQGENGMLRTIEGRTTRIPTAGNGNVSYINAAPDSDDYNAMDYQYGESFHLYMDNSPITQAYMTTPGMYLVMFSGDEIASNFRLPPKLIPMLGSVCEENSSCDLNGDGILNDPGVLWIFSGTDNGTSFSIYATKDGSGFTLGDNDTYYRERLLELASSATFSDSKDPINQDTSPTTLHIVPAGLSLENMNFNQLFQDTTSHYLQLYFFLPAFLRMAGNTLFYPFIEYYLETDTPISNTYFTIIGKGKVGDYETVLVLKKPIERKINPYIQQLTFPF